MRLMTLRTAGDHAQQGFTPRHSATGYRGGSRSPIGIGGTVAVHAVVAGLFLLMPKEVIDRIIPPTIEGYAVPEPTPPPPNKKDPPIETKVQPKQQPTTVTDPIVKTTPGDFTTKPDPLPRTNDGTGTGASTEIITPPPPTLPDPVITQAGIDPRALAAFQPDYPGAMIRQGLEGTVTVRVSIGADGRVADIERLSATDEAFWLATQRHALRKWRFRPATRDGVPIASIKTLTVHFRLSNI